MLVSDFVKMVDWVIGRGIAPVVMLVIILIIVGYIAFRIVNTIENWITLTITILVIFLYASSMWVKGGTVEISIGTVVLGVFGHSIYQRLLRR